ncbi:MAG: VanZ family protein [Anaerolineae bacterium]|nr:VanZ family protein [Anaerolineae bacterium]
MSQRLPVTRAATLLRPFLADARLRWGISLLWTAVVLTLMLSPSGEGTLTRWLSQLLGGTEATDALGHIFLYGSLTLVWGWTLRLHLRRRTAVLAAGVIVLALSFATETAQEFVATRGTAALDYAANLTGVGLAMALRAGLDRREKEKARG